MGGGGEASGVGGVGTEAGEQEGWVCGEGVGAVED